MDTRQFLINGYLMTVKRNIGPGPYLYTNEKGREMIADSGDFLVMKGDKVTAHLPAEIVDAMALNTEEQLTVERTRRVADDRTVQDQYIVEVKAGEKFDGTRVVGEDGMPVEREDSDLTKARIRRKISSDELLPNGELKSKEDKEDDVKAKQFAVSHPVNIFNEAAGRAAQEVVDLAAAKAARHDDDMKDIEASEEDKKRQIDTVEGARADKLGTSQTYDPQTEDEKVNQARTLDAQKDTIAAHTLIEQQKAQELDDFGFPKVATASQPARPAPESAQQSATSQSVQTQPQASVVKEREETRERSAREAMIHGSSAGTAKGPVDGIIG